MVAVRSWEGGPAAGSGAGRPAWEPYLSGPRRDLLAEVRSYQPAVRTLPLGFAYADSSNDLSRARDLIVPAWPPAALAGAAAAGLGRAGPGCAAAAGPAGTRPGCAPRAGTTSARAPGGARNAGGGRGGWVEVSGAGDPEG
jgi:hypothetical protein